MAGSDSDVEVTVEVIGDLVTVKSNKGGRANGRLRLDDLTRDTLRVFSGLLEDKGRIKKRSELEVLGRHLFNVLFDDVTRPFMETRLSDASKERRLRIMLDLSGGPPDLASFPWEYLFYYSRSANSFFFSTRSDLVL